MNNKEAIIIIEGIRRDILPNDGVKRTEDIALDLAIKALEKDKCSTCMHYDKDYGETCLNPEGTCRVFEYDGYEEAENDHP